MKYLKTVKLEVFLLFFAVTIGCSMNQKQSFTPVSYAGGNSGLGHMLKVNAKISGEDVLLIFDTGIGVNLISKSLCSKLNCKINDSVTGKRMTGQSVTIPMSKIESLQVAAQKELNVDVGVLDFDSFLPKTNEFDGVQGYLSLNFFKGRPFTVDYRSGQLIFETPESLDERLKNSEVIPIQQKEEGPALTIQLPVKTQIKKTLNMQLDLGTDIMTLNSDYSEKFKPYFDGKILKKDSIIDETNFKRDRFYVKLRGELGPQSKNTILQSEPTVMFQKIIYDGIIGNDYFKNKIVTYDLGSSRLLINRK